MNSVTGKSSGYKCRVILHQCLAIVIRKEGCKGNPGDFWMYENGYLLFQGLLSSNSVCWWNTGLNGATRSLVYHGYISPGALLVGSEPCAIDIVKNAWSRRVLQPPPGYQIVALEDIENCIGTPIIQTQWTPLPEAVCAVVLRLSRQGRPAGLETIREALIMTFPHVSPPSEQALYDTLVQLTTERKLYHTSNGYFIVTPERRRSRSHSRGRKKFEDDMDQQITTNKTMLMSTEEALVMVHGDMATIRDGDVTHQMIQTNLADVICGGNSSDKILYPRKHRLPFSTISSRSPDRRGSFRLWRSSRRLRRSASTRSLAKNYAAGDSTTTSSTEGSTNTTQSSPNKKESLLSRLFRKQKRSQCQINTFSAQFPPSEWFNSKAVHLHSIGTQTSAIEKDVGAITSYLENCEIKPSRAATLPRQRRHCRQLSDIPYNNSAVISRDNSPLPRKNPSLCTLPRKTKSRDSSRKTSRSSSLKDENKNNNKNCDIIEKTSQKLNSRLVEPSSSNLDNSGPSSIESHKESSITSGPSSLESHKTVINRNDITETSFDTKLKKSSPLSRKTSTTTSTTTPIAKQQKNNRKLPSSSSSFTLHVTTNQGSNKLNNKSNSTSTTTTINGESGSSTKIFVQNSPVRSVITLENGLCEANNPNFVIINDTDNSPKLPTKNTNQSMNNSRDPIQPENFDTMNNSRKLSLQLTNNKDGLNYHNLIKNVSSASSNNNNQFSILSNSTPDSPIGDLTKNFDITPPLSPIINTKSSQSIDKIYIKTSLEGTKIKNVLGSEPNISYKETITKDAIKDQQYPSLNDLTFNFTSLAAQKILKGVGLNSVDTLVELNMSNVDKQNNCDVLHTDFGLF